ncbi:heptaprenylglyceryl phosphate synthase [Ornithinibacillus sp. BX22]|uniref:Heptaprenylglyceryl phosphate synthase n=2 Tax=Ornithinibacillus TaxID=484508 RepID=A0A923L4G8_9BACI|nr:MULTISPECIES: heptaprenylglyceryl phosphate synthase [Ornithinibacillus]MBC5636299.1 heptaprenylglyceryl phosphate synthase [Ornithinibacillus hominis]MBS3681141.1 heptaprenylglyceryl phosphate synthase [Ornithinibacillus massiliensis]
MKEWKHVFKLDPAKEIDDEDLELICESGTDAIIVGGTDNVTLDGVLDLLSSIRRYTVPVILEISTMEAITPGFDYYYIPMVMNSTEKKWMMDIQHEAIKEYKDIMNWNEIFVEGYCILNEEAKAFQHASCKLPSDEDVVAYAYMAENVFHLPIFYIEYSGKYGNPELLQKVRGELTNTLLFYGGGIEKPEQAREMKNHADVIVVGNSIYTNLKEALKTVHAVKSN